ILLCQDKIAAIVVISVNAGCKSAVISSYSRIKIVVISAKIRCWSPNRPWIVGKNQGISVGYYPVAQGITRIAAQPVWRDNELVEPCIRNNSFCQVPPGLRHVLSARSPVKGHTQAEVFV